MTVVSLTLDVDTKTVGEARRFLVEALTEWGAQEYLYGAPQVLSELATNAALHSHGPYTVTLRRESESLLIEVTDASPRLPQRRHYALDATTGRGMGLVDALSLSWGTTPVPGGKTVWARLGPDRFDAFPVDLAALSAIEDRFGDDPGDRSAEGIGYRARGRDRRGVRAMAAVP